MKIEKLVLSIEQMQELANLGLDTTDASFGWICENGDAYIQFADECSFEDGAIPAYCFTDILKKLPVYCKIEKHINRFGKIRYNAFLNNQSGGETIINENPLIVAYDMLVHCLKCADIEILHYYGGYTEEEYHKLFSNEH